MSEKVDIESLQPIPNPQTQEGHEFNKALAEYRKAKEEHQRLTNALEKLRDPRLVKTAIRDAFGAARQLHRGHVSETEKAEFAWLKKKLGEARTPEQKAKAEEKLANWRKAHPAASIILEQRDHPTS